MSDMKVPSGPSGSPSVVRSKQEPISLVENLVEKFCELSRTVVDFCVGTESTVKAFLIPPKHFELFGCDADSHFTAKSNPSISKLFAEHVLNDDSDITQAGKEQAASKRYLRRSAAAVENRRKKIWQSPRGLSAIQMFPHYIKVTVYEYHEKINLYDHARHLTCTLRFLK